MRRLRMLVALGVSTLPAAAHPQNTGTARPAARAQQGGEEEAAERKIVGGGKIPAGWTAKTDRDAPIEKVKVELTPAGVHLETAVTVTLYQAADILGRNYHLGATFTQTEATPGHAEPYGLIFGGSVKGDTLGYTYFMIQADGKFSVRRRTGTRSQDLGSGWMESTAIQQAGDKRTYTNRLLIERTPTTVRFMINGTEVLKLKADPAQTDGFTGYRVSHNLALQVGAVMRMQM